MELLLTFLTGATMIIGTILVFVFKNNQKFVTLITNIAFGVLTCLILFELIPEIIIELLDQYNTLTTILITIIFTILGMSILKVIDIFIPNHHDKNEDNNLYHIALITAISLIIHNIIEGISVYNSLINNFQNGIIICLGIGLHNIILGTILTSFYYQKNNKIKTILFITLISLSSLLGGIIANFLQNSLKNINPFLLTITLGMLIYITLFELLPEITKEKNNKNTIFQILLGILIFSITIIL